MTLFHSYISCEAEAIVMSASQPSTGLRSSCDRCRLQKLRCAPSSASSPNGSCQRCVRAKSTCVFSPKGRVGRHPTKQRQNSALAPSVTSPNTPGELSPATNAIAREAELPELTQDPIFNIEDGAGNNTATSGNYHDVNHFSADIHLTQRIMMDDTWCIPRPEGYNNWLTNTPQSIQFSPSFDLVGSDSILPELDITPLGEPIFRPADQVDYLATTTTGPSHILGCWSQDNANESSKPFRNLDLSTLLVEMNTYLESLKQYKLSGSADEIAPGLDDYPMGDALFLSQQFCSLVSTWPARHTLSTLYSPAATLVEGCSSSSDSSLGDEADSALDKSTMVLGLSCYSTLIRIINIIFDHLQMHLTQLPELAALSSSTEAWSLRRGLRLGELLPTSWAACARTRSAVGVLATSLAEAERLVGFSAEVACSPTLDPPGADGGGFSSRTEPGVGQENYVVVVIEGQDRTVVNVDGMQGGLREQTRELKLKMEGVRELLKGLLGS